MSITAQQLRELAEKANPKEATPLKLLETPRWDLLNLVLGNLPTILSALELQERLGKPETVEEVALAWEPDKAWDAFTLWFFRECNAGTRRHLWSIFCLPVDEIRDEGTERIAWKYIRGQIIAMKGTAQ